LNTQMAHSHVEHSNSRLHVASTVYIAIGVTLFASLLPNIFWQETTHSSSAWLLWAKLALLGFFILGSTLWKAIQPLRTYFVILAVLYLAEWSSSLIGETAQWKSLFSVASFTVNMLGIQLLRLLTALIMIAVLFSIKRHRRNFFLVAGQTNASVQPVPWLGINGVVLWSRLGVIAALCISLGTLAFLLIAGTPSIDILLKVLPVLPAVVIFALMNSFSEELNYRAALLATLDGVVSRPQAIFLTAAYFGIGHFYGVPYGVLGVLMAGVLGWLLGKAMLETRGFLWPWVIHFLQDVLIFSFIAMGSIVAGGK
jgi:uncharacterized protein